MDHTLWNISSNKHHFPLISQIDANECFVVINKVFFHPYGEDTGEGDHCGIPLTQYSMTAPMHHCIYYLLELTTHNWSAGVYRSVGRSTGGVYSPNVIIYNT